MARILVVDNDRAVLQNLEAVLQNAGHQCVCSTSGLQALEIVREQNIDLMVLDVMLPQLSGFEICRRIHSDTSLYTMPVLILSAMSDEEEVAHGLAQGADAFLAKPFQAEEVLHQVEALLARVHTPMVDAETSLPGPRFIRLEMQKYIHLQRPFAAIYVELLRDASASAGGQQKLRGKAIQVLARNIYYSGKEQKDVSFRACHRGGGHFVRMIEPAQSKAFSTTLYEQWQSAVPELTEQCEEDGALDVLVCVTGTTKRYGSTVAHYFEILSQLRANALQEQTTGVYTDRRA